MRTEVEKDENLSFVSFAMLRPLIFFFLTGKKKKRRKKNKTKNNNNKYNRNIK